MSQQAPAIIFENVSKTYYLYKNSQEQFLALFRRRKSNRTHEALKNVSLTIQPGEAVGIIGNNGAGKSTLLKMITGVTFPTSGTVTVNGRVAALLELTAGFSGEMTGRENIGLKGLILGLTAEEIKAIEPNIIEFADLGEYIDQPVRTYSSGMKMRLGFAININIRPDILVIDEALSVGDATFRKKCTSKISELQKTGITVLYVSHSPSGIRDVCTRTVYLKKGQVIFDGGVEEGLKIYAADK
ncbi:MAG: ABC transporter ATP-binding protein [Oscillospiraceae bacterium]|nr:ABC transporter ATP-binding protein [Oscillospiraceae bacterium]MBQ8731720.1 ABC transporter ATP-binding protein [Oscillospiraceae bacterium]